MHPSAVPMKTMSSCTCPTPGNAVPNTVCSGCLANSFIIKRLLYHCEQIREILSKMGEGRQTLLFSATLPRSLADFASAGLNAPVLVRLDAERRISPDLKLTFLTARADEKVQTRRRGPGAPANLNQGTWESPGGPELPCWGSMANVM
eukprot:1161339-Pelagomonas_calceolata.AAC.5